jgi:hypothetical protein
MLHLDMVPADDGDEVQLVELDSSQAAPAGDDRHPVQGIAQ